MPLIPHEWWSPADIAAQLGAKRQGNGWRVKCPVHGGDNPQSLSIAEGVDNVGHPVTLLYCHTKGCTIAEITAAIGCEVRNLWAVHPEYGKTLRNAPRARGGPLSRLQTMADVVPQDIAETIVLIDIVDDPTLLQTSKPVRQLLATLVQSPSARRRLLDTLTTLRIPTQPFLAALRQEFPAC